MTANLRGPIFVSKQTRKGKQCVSPRDEYRTRHDILEEMASRRSNVLILSRKKTRKIKIGDDIELWVVDIRGDTVKLGIQAPKHVKVFRQEGRGNQPPTRPRIEPRWTCLPDVEETLDAQRGQQKNRPDGRFFHLPTILTEA